MSAREQLAPPGGLLAAALVEALAADPAAVSRLRELVAIDSPRPMAPEPVIYTVASLAAVLQVSARVVRGAIARGELHAAKRGGRYLISARAVRRLGGSPVRTSMLRTIRSRSLAPLAHAARCAPPWTRWTTAPCSAPPPGAEFPAATPMTPRGSLRTRRPCPDAMSVEKVQRQSREVVWRVRWREHGRNRARTFSSRRDALDFDADRRRARRAGTLTLLDAGAETLDDYVTGTWVQAHAALLAPKTRRDYASYYDHYISPRLGNVPLRELTPDAIARLQAELLRAGLGHEATRKTVHVVLKGMLTHAAQSGLILANPARAVRMARAPMRDEVRPLAPETVERMRALLLDRPERRIAPGVERARASRAEPPRRHHHLRARLRGAAAAGTPPPAMAPREGADARHRRAKTGRRRSVRLLDHLAADLHEWRVASPRPMRINRSSSGEDGAAWTAEGFNKWRQRVFVPTIRAVGLDHARPYDLRHSFASLLLHEGRSVIYVARQLGHGADLTLGTYGHTIEELDDAPGLAPTRRSRRQGEAATVRSTQARGRRSTARRSAGTDAASPGVERERHADAAETGQLRQSRSSPFHLRARARAPATDRLSMRARRATAVGDDGCEQPWRGKRESAHHTVAPTQ